MLAVVLLVLGSWSNVVGYQLVQTSRQRTIHEAVNQKELLFQTICDIANNKEVQQIILKSQINRGIFSVSRIPVLTKNQLRQMFVIGVVLSKVVSKSRMQSMVSAYQFKNQGMQKAISAVIEKDTTLKEELSQLQNSACNCENEKTTRLWHFPFICTLLIPFYSVALFLVLGGWRWDLYFCEIIGAFIGASVEKIASLLECKWYLNEHNQGPWFSNISPADGEQNVSLSLTELSFYLYDPEGDAMSYKVTTSPDIGSGSATFVHNGTYTVPIHGLKNSTTYAWYFYLYYTGDLSGTPLGKTFTFTTVTLAPLIRDPSPRENAQFVPINMSNVSFDLTDYQGDLMNWTVETQPDIGSGTGTRAGNGRYTVPISGLDYFSTYTWFVNATDGTYWTKKTFSFRTTTENTVVLEPTDDATILENYPTGNSGTDESITLRSISGWEWDGLMKFNLSAVPSNITILYASLQMYYYKNWDGNPNGHQVNTYRITNDWNEENVTWNTRPSSVTEPSSFANMPAMINNWVFWNLTGDVFMFYNSSTPNYGWRIMDTSGDNTCSYFQSKECREYHPLLVIGYE